MKSREIKDFDFQGRILKRGIYDKEGDGEFLIGVDRNWIDSNKVVLR